MPVFGKVSRNRLATVHWSLRLVLNVAIRIVDFSVVTGRRGKGAQDLAFRSGRSKVRWPDGKHNAVPPKKSDAVDVAPHPTDWSDRERFYLLAGVILTVAWFLQVPLRWGGDWDGDWDLRDQTFDDLGHFERADRETRTLPSRVAQHVIERAMEG